MIVPAGKVEVEEYPYLASFAEMCKRVEKEKVAFGRLPDNIYSEVGENRLPEIVDLNVFSPKRWPQGAER
jgi:hypothetical protein